MGLLNLHGVPLPAFPPAFMPRLARRVSGTARFPFNQGAITPPALLRRRGGHRGEPAITETALPANPNKERRTHRFLTNPETLSGFGKWKITPSQSSFGVSKSRSFQITPLWLCFAHVPLNLLLFRSANPRWKKCHLGSICQLNKEKAMSSVVFGRDHTNYPSGFSANFINHELPPRSLAILHDGSCHRLSISPPRVFLVACSQMPQAAAGGRANHPIGAKWQSGRLTRQKWQRNGKADLFSDFILRLETLLNR
jgi:hypothetical protein